MSEYQNFSRCVICRSKKNLECYEGNFEITMLLDTLYLAVMYPLEKRKDLHIKAKRISNYLCENEIVNTCGNKFTTDDIARYLRNGLAHFNVEVNSGATLDKQIRNIKIWAENVKKQPKCEPPCETPKCLPVQYKEENGAICVFSFTIDSLKAFTDFLIKEVMQTLDDNVCHGCPYQEDEKNGNTDLR